MEENKKKNKYPTRKKNQQIFSLILFSASCLFLSLLRRLCVCLSLSLFITSGMTNMPFLGWLDLSTDLECPNYPCESSYLRVIGRGCCRRFAKSVCFFTSSPAGFNLKPIISLLDVNIEYVLADFDAFTVVCFEKLEGINGNFYLYRIVNNQSQTTSTD